MSALADRLTRIADRIHLTERWLQHDDIEKAREAIAGVHDELVAIAEEIDR